MSTSGTKRIMFYVQHLLGVGHVRRAVLISDAMVAEGHDVHMVLGGTDVPGVDFSGTTIHTLPEARAADASFSAIVDAAGSEIDDHWHRARCETLLNIFDSIAPEILMIELYPFGRRQFRFELLPLLDMAKDCSNPPRIVCSVRDLLVKKNKPERAQETADIVNRYFDHVLVHGDPDFLPLDASFDATDQIAGKVSYTGYVCPPPALDTNAGRDEVVVATGGGAVGSDLLKAAIAAKPLSSLNDHTWRILIGPNVPAETLAELNNISDDGVIIEPNRPDYPSLLKNCKLSISQAGYNTLMDVVTAGCPSVMVPFSEGNETEQSVRAQLLADKNHLTILAEINLSPASLAHAVDTAMSQSRPDSPPFDVTGAATTARKMTIL